MDKNKIKSFAVWARRSLIGAVKEKAHRIGIYEDKIIEATAVQGGFKLEGKEEIFHLSKSHRDALVSQIKQKDFEQVMEEVAYTWFNRFMGLRYMEVNDYLPSGIRILSSEVEGKKEPDVLTRVSEVIDELELNSNEIYDLLDSGNTLDREKAYRIILVKQCNELGKIIPQMFEKISDYTELLLPDNLLEEGSVIRQMVEDIEESDWLEEVEIIGWMYQYYIAEEKDRVIHAKKRYKKNEVPFATQLFTPKWIVKYMVENSLGRLWIEGHPNEKLKNTWKYYLENMESGPESQEELNKIREEQCKLRPEDIKVLDPSMGSGHILVYAFDVLYEIYKTTGYSEREIPRLILQNNLYGLDIDDRAAQLASFALIMKARHYNRRLFREIERENLDLNICSIQESNGIDIEEINYFCSTNYEADNKYLRGNLECLLNSFIDAKEYGSILEIKKVDFEVLKQRLEDIKNDDNLVFSDYRNIILDKLPIIIKQAEIMSRNYDICITNPPYMGSKYMSSKLLTYINNNYAEVKSDLFSVFIINSFRRVKKYGHLGFLTPFVWMFIQSYEKLRKEIVNNKSISSLIQLEYNAFPEACVPVCAFTLRNDNSKINGEYIKLSDFKGSNVQEVKVMEAIESSNVLYRYSLNSNSFKSIEGNIIAYWLSKKMINSFIELDKINDIADAKKGLDTSDNDRFLRLWHEVCIDNIGINKKSSEEFDKSNFTWVPLNKGGVFRRWYGNRNYILKWKNNGSEVKQFEKATVRNERFYFKKGITWSDISTGKFSGRFSEEGFIFDATGHMMFMNNVSIRYMLAYVNTKVFQEYTNIVCPGLHYNNGSIGKIPILINESNYIDGIVDSSINIARNDWDSFETSWDFKGHPLLKLIDKDKQYKISYIFNIWETECEEAFKKLKYNEEELNRIFIDIYGLQDELTLEVDDKDVAIRKADRERDIKSFISYVVGCILGRYSIDTEGLIYAGGEFNDKWNITDKKVRKIEKDEEGNITSDVWIDSRFLPDSDNIIPITEDEYFEDDIVSRFIEFVRTVYGNDTLEENLDFIADSIGRKSSETSRQVIRRFFIKDFYKDHLKVYQKRPIYWMFESGKNDGFKCLIYMHRYNDQTVAKVRTDYLHTLQRKYEAEINRLQLVVDSEQHTAKDRKVAKNKIDRISKQIEECREYDEVVAHLANEKISIDLDDGVKVNYARFQDVKIINSKGKEVKMNLLSKI